MTDSETRSTYEAVADRYRERHADRSVVEPLVEQFTERLDDVAGSEGARVLDVGCGPGWESATFAERGHDPVGVDLTSAFLRIAREEAPGAALARMDMRHLGFEANAFDGVWALASFLHVPREDAPGTLAEFHRVLRPGGVLHLSVKRGEGTERVSFYEGDDRRFVYYQPEELESLLVEAGFEVESRAVEATETTDWLQVSARGTRP